MAKVSVGWLSILTKKEDIFGFEFLKGNENNKLQFLIPFPQFLLFTTFYSSLP